MYMVPRRCGTVFRTGPAQAAINFLDRCAITIPISPPGEAPVGLTAVGAHGEDRRLLAMALGIEALIERERRR